MLGRLSPESQMAAEVVVHFRPLSRGELVVEVYPQVVEAVAGGHGAVQGEGVEQPTDDLRVRHDQDTTRVEQDPIHILQHSHTLLCQTRWALHLLVGCPPTLTSQLLPAGVPGIGTSCSLGDVQRRLERDVVVLRRFWLAFEDQGDGCRLRSGTG